MLKTKRQKIVAGVIASLVIIGGAAFAVGPPPPSKSTTDQAVVAASDAQTIEKLDPLHGRPITMSHWSPAGADRSHLVVISHGYGGDRTSHDYLAKELTQQGYTVIAPTHPDVAGLQSGDPELDPLVLRPRHLSLAIDAAEETSAESFEQVTVLGHSLGGYGALRVAGAEVSVEGVEAHCATSTNDGTKDEVLCTPRARDRFLALAALRSGTGDHRVDQIVLLAPGYGPLFSPESLTNIATPALVIQASSDRELPGGQVDDIIAGLPDTTSTQTIDGGHFDFVRECSTEESATIPELCTSQAGVERSEFHQEVGGSITEFLDS